MKKKYKVNRILEVHYSLGSFTTLTFTKSQYLASEEEMKSRAYIDQHFPIYVFKNINYDGIRRVRLAVENINKEVERFGSKRNLSSLLN